MEFRTWVQGVTFCTRMDYLTPMFQEAAYCLSIERLLGITDQIPERASIIRVLMMELTRINSHLVCLGTGGMEIGATTVMTVGFRERERILRVFEAVTGLRMNNAYIRPGGVSQDVPHGAVDMVREVVIELRRGPARARAAAQREPAAQGPHRRRRLPGPHRLHGARHHRPGAALDRPAARPAQVGALLRLRDLRLRGHHPHRLRRLRPAAHPHRRDVRVAEDRRADPRPAAAHRGPAGHGRGQEDRLAGPAGHRRRRPGQQPRPHPRDHGHLDGVADPPLQARHRGLPRPAGPGLRRRSSRPRASSAATPSPTAAPAPTGRTSATRASTTCRPWPRCARAARSPTSSSRWPPSTPSWEVSTADGPRLRPPDRVRSPHRQ